MRRCEGVIYDSVIWKVWCWIDNYNCVRVDSLFYSCNFSFFCFLVNWDDMKFDVEVFWCFLECCVGWWWDDFEIFISWYFFGERRGSVYFWFCDIFGYLCLVLVGFDGYKNRFSVIRSSCKS